MLSRFITIPELVVSLAEHLLPQDLFTCVQVNRAWNQAFIPYLWERIDDSVLSWPAILLHVNHSWLASSTSSHAKNVEPSKFLAVIKSRNSDFDKDRDWLISVFSKYGQHIRELKLRSMLTLRAVCYGGTCTRLQSLEFRSTRYVVSPGFFMDYTCPADPMVDGADSIRDLLANESIGHTSMARSNMGLSEAIDPDQFMQRVCKESCLSCDTTAGSYSARVIWDYLWYLVRINPGIMRLDTSQLPLNSVGAPLDFMYGSLQTLASLRHLDLSTFNQDDFWSLYSRLPVSIESLAAERCHLFPLPAHLPKPSLRLRVLLAQGSTNMDGLVTLLGIFPNLEHLKFDDLCNNRADGLSPAALESNSSATILPPPSVPLGGGGQSLKKLDATVDDWLALLQLFPSIVHWQTDGKLDEDDLAFLDTHFAHLESYSPTYQPWYVDGDVRGGKDLANHLLATRPRLRVFDNIRHFINVDEMLRQPWVCMGLEWLSCRIVGVERLTLDEELVVMATRAAQAMASESPVELSAEETRVIQKASRCRAQHYGVYGQLAKLTRLRHLDLGFENRYPWEYKSGEWYVGDDGEDYLQYDPPTFDTLELTLESGLGRLATLKNLEMFGFECVNHKIGEAELEWMAKSWPKLKLMYGLDRERLEDIEHCKTRVALREYFGKLRPDVVHDSLFHDDV